MPISSGANSWPNKYFKPGSPKQGQPKVIVVQDNPGYSPEASPLPSKRLPSPEVVRYEEHEHVYEGGEGPPPKQTQVIRTDHHGSYNDYYMYGPDGYGRYGPKGRVMHGKDGKYVNYTQNKSRSGYWRTGPDGRRVWVSSHTTRVDSNGRVGDEGGKTCCFFGGSDYYTTGVAGAGAGCCAGGMFGSRRYPYGPEHHYDMKGTGRRRCWACLLGLLLALLLLGLLLGMLLGVKAAVDRKNRQDKVSSTLTGGYFVDGVYYYPITNPPDIFYFAMGPLVPCNIYNNNSDIPPPTGDYAFVTDTATVTHWVTDEPLVTVPDCQDVTTQYILAQNYTPPPTPAPAVVVVTVANNYGHHNVASVSLGLAIMTAAVHMFMCALQRKWVKLD